MASSAPATASSTNMAIAPGDANIDARRATCSAWASAPASNWRRRRRASCPRSAGGWRTGPGIPYTTRHHREHLHRPGRRAGHVRCRWRAWPPPWATAASPIKPHLLKKVDGRHRGGRASKLPDMRGELRRLRAHAGEARTGAQGHVEGGHGGRRHRPGGAHPERGSRRQDRHGPELAHGGQGEP